jgi:hypothetical protein
LSSNASGIDAGGWCSRPLIDKNGGNAIVDDVEAVPGLQIPVGYTLKFREFAAVFRSGSLVEIRCDLYFPALGATLPFTDATR